MCFCQEKMATWIAVSSEVPSYTSAQDFHRFRHCHVRFVHVFTRLYSQRRSFELTSLWNLMLPLGNWLLWLLWRSTFGVVAQCVHGFISAGCVLVSAGHFWPFHGCRSFCSLCAYPTMAGPLPMKMSDTMFVPRTVFRHFTLPPLDSQRYKDTELFTQHPVVTQKNLYMCLLLDVDVCWWMGRSLALVAVSLRSCQNLALDACYLSDVFTSVCTGSNSMNVFGLCVVVV